MLYLLLSSFVVLVSYGGTIRRFYDLKQNETSKVKHCSDDILCSTAGQPSAAMTSVMRLIYEERVECKAKGQCPQQLDSVVNSAQPCVNGVSDGTYSCNNVGLQSFVSLSDLGSSSSADGNDIWGWQDPDTGRYYALTGQTDGASIVDVTDANNPVVIGFLPSNVNRNVVWRDVKVFQNFAYFVADDALNNHGMQYFDLTRVRDPEKLRREAKEFRADGAVTVLSPDGVYTEFGACHNIFVNEDTGFLYAVGTRTCSGGLHIVDVNDPANPVYAGCFSQDGYTHDVECVVYNGPDSRYTGREVCFAYNEDTLTIVDVTDKNNFDIISRTGYNGASYTHQGWLTDDHSHLLLDDELDEVYGENDGHTETYIWSVIDLENPSLLGSYFSPVLSVDHNLYIIGDRAYESNYESGLRILDISGIASGDIKEVGFFDVYPEADSVSFNGAWSVYPDFGTDRIVLQSIDRGLFVLNSQV